MTRAEFDGLTPGETARIVASLGRKLERDDRRFALAPWAVFCAAGVRRADRRPFEIGDFIPRRTPTKKKRMSKADMEAQARIHFASLKQYFRQAGHTVKTVSNGQ